MDAKKTLGRLNRRMPLLTADNRGQSTIEYLVVTFFLIAGLITAPSVYQKISHTITNKYHSYRFGVAISDPPRKAFDDSMRKDAGKVESVFDTLEKIKDLIGNSIFPDLTKGKLPAWKDIKKFGDLVKRLL